jgi:hypothetical protein
LSRELRSHYPEETKHNAAKLWLVTGNLSQVATSMNIPYYTVKEWQRTKWWQELVEDIRSEGHLALSLKMRKVADKAIEETMDRLENGDHVVSPTGGLIRKPVAMRDAHQVAVSFQDRALKLESGQHTEVSLAVVDRLEQIAAAFAKMAKPKKTDIIDVEYTEHALPEEREEGLQAGSTVGEREEAPTLEGPGYEDSGEADSGEVHR